MFNLPDLLSLILSLASLVCIALLQANSFPSLWEALPAWVSRPILTILYIFPALVVILTAVLISTSLKMVQRPNLPTEASSNNTRPGPQRLILRVGLAVILLISMAYVTFWASVWDQTSDGLGGIWFAYQSCLAAVISGAVMGIKARSWFRSAGFFFALLVPILMIGSFSSGWTVSYHTLTEQRAARIAAALTRYHTRAGHYPDGLQDLVPRDLFYIPSQVILREEGWCYQGGQDYYRLGAYWRKNFSTPLEIKIYASTGNPPEVVWNCQDRLPELKQKYDIPGYFEFNQP